MNELTRIAGLLRNAHEGDPWHGSSRRHALAGVTAAQAVRRPIAGAHTIWEIVLHSTAWAREVTRRLKGGSPAPPEGGDWPPVPNPADDAAWVATLEDLDRSRMELIDAVAGFDPARLNDLVGVERNPALGTGVTWYEMLHGLVHHEIYHTGQISLLKQAG